MKDLEKALHNATCYRVIGMFDGREWVVQLRTHKSALPVSVTAPTLLEALTRALESMK